MNKRIIIVLVVILLIGGGVYALTANKKDDNTPQTNTNNTSQNQSTNQQSNTNTAPTSTNTVSIENFAFSPPDITVKKGTTVTWTNNDSTPHTVTETDNQSGPKSGNLNNGDKYTFTFDTAGTFHYKCSIHPSMLGTVTVTE